MNSFCRPSSTCSSGAPFVKVPSHNTESLLSFTAPCPFGYPFLKEPSNLWMEPNYTWCIITSKTIGASDHLSHVLKVAILLPVGVKHQRIHVIMGDMTWHPLKLRYSQCFLSIQSFPSVSFDTILMPIPGSITEIKDSWSMSVTSLEAALHMRPFSGPAPHSLSVHLGVSHLLQL